MSAELDITTFAVVSTRGLIDLKSSFVSASIYESIFTPGIVMDISILDTGDLLGAVRLSGDETVILEFNVPGATRVNLLLALHQLAEVESRGAQHAKRYVLKCVSEEALFAMTNYVQKSYTMLCSEIVKDLHENYLKSTKPLDVEPTRGPQSIVIANRNPYQAINLVRQRAVSVENRSSLFCFFENRGNEQQRFNFTTIERLFTQPVVKQFQQSDAINTSILNQTDNNILAFRIPQQFSSLDWIEYGGPRTINTFNFTTWQFESRTVQTSEENYRDGGEGRMQSDRFRNRYHNPVHAPQSMIPIDISQRPETNIAQSQADVQAYLSLLAQNSVRIRVPGDPRLTAGSMVDLRMPSRNGLTGPPQLDRFMSGKFLVSRIHHRIGEFTDQPRYTCIMECIKGGSEQGIDP